MNSTYRSKHSFMEQSGSKYWGMRRRSAHDQLPPSTTATWEEQAFARDAAANDLGGCVWPPRSYSCSFCHREFRSAQALGGHMNVHRRDRALLRHGSSSGQDDDVDVVQEEEAAPTGHAQDLPQVHGSNFSKPSTTTCTPSAMIKESKNSSSWVVVDLASIPATARQEAPDQCPDNAADADEESGSGRSNKRKRQASCERGVHLADHHHRDRHDAKVPKTTTSPSSSSSRKFVDDQQGDGVDLVLRLGTSTTPNLQSECKELK